jgi:hypothetical protein
MPRHDLQAVCDSINDECGTGGQTRLARMIGVDPRTVRNKLACKSKITRSDERAIHDALRELRQQKTRPEPGSWCSGQFPCRSALCHEAVFPYVVLSIDNNLAERMFRAQTIGRRNWTFQGSDRGGRTAAVLYSYTGTCKHHGIDPFAYLRDVLGRLPAQPVDRLAELLPDVWFEAHPQARRNNVA